MVGFLEKWSSLVLAEPAAATAPKETERAPTLTQPSVEPVRAPITPEVEREVPWAEWKAAELNRLFQEQGVTGEPGRITAATIRHGGRSVSEPGRAIRQLAHRPAVAGLGDVSD